jgi:hypothetical protein
VGDAGKDQGPVGVELLEVVGHLVEGVGEVGQLCRPALGEAGWDFATRPTVRAAAARALRGRLRRETIM